MMVFSFSDYIYFFFFYKSVATLCLTLFCDAGEFTNIQSTWTNTLVLIPRTTVGLTIFFCVRELNPRRSTSVDFKSNIDDFSAQFWLQLSLRISNIYMKCEFPDACASKNYVTGPSVMSLISLSQKMLVNHACDTVV